MMSNSGDMALVVESWFDGERHHRNQTTFLIREGRIAGIDAGDHGSDHEGRGIPVERGTFVMPGLVDAHVHLFLDGAPTDMKQRSAHLKQPVEILAETARNSARQSLACGVTLVRDAGDRHGLNNRMREEARQDVSMARVRSCGIGLRRPGRYGSFMALEAADDEAIRSSVAELCQHNDEIKLLLTGIIDFDAGAVTDEPQFDANSARLVVEAARLHQRKTIAHCSGTKGLEIAVEAAVGSIEHGFFINRIILEQMAEKHIAWTPTFCPVHFQWAHPEAAGWSKQTIGNLRRILDDHAKHLQVADEMGVPLLLGTDAGSMGVEHGYAIFNEIDCYLKAGLSMEHTLRAATAAGRSHFGFEAATLKRGSPFEAILLDVSPFEDVRGLRQPRKVWVAH
jgi:imidazolonepropionase-like amidohydrolase